ncbi:hypothetical protein D5R81_19210 [Parashewanella spongiae]|uniref:IPT/TIG domain-containing protein n=1 Tax=Parashewanella spongiae TaxID=342950 RepID=A0A3A6TPW7_9GAMM|nr:hypothetical protein [Parashewanella spongiae]MCL1080161.1 hypothetical protein [Parashewanella spongiae]RJY02442.1 hypothetical protein D5R81_19210 [Parashewanella spongiae]
MKTNLLGHNTRSFLCLLLLITFVSTTASLQAKTKDTIQVGTWKNKDEDGDGVLDEHDDYPFNPNKSSFPLIKEKEFNNNLTVANDAGQVPFISTGSFELDIDIDDYKFIVTQDDIESRIPFHFIVLSENSTLSPRISVLNANGKGELAATADGNLKNVGLIKNSRLFFPEKAGIYHLTVGNRNNKADPNLTYRVLAIKDTDMDGIPDEKEKALGSHYEIQDTDGDEIFDGNEFFIHQNITTIIADVDSDGIPNWLDKDTDGDSILDLREGLVNQDFDIIPSFADFDSDDDGINDIDEASAGRLYIDKDRDGALNYQDIDDDGDGVINTYDNDDKQSIKFNKKVKLYNVNTTVGEMDLTNKVKPFYPTKLFFSGEHSRDAVKLSDGAVLVLRKFGSQPSTINIKLKPFEDSRRNLEFVVPNYQKIDSGGNKISLSLVTDGKKTNDIHLTLIHHRGPLLSEVKPDVNIIGKQAFIEGINFTGDLKVKLNDFEIIPEIVSRTSASFIIPKRARSGLLSISNEYGVSNDVDFTVGDEIKISTSIPPSFLSIDGGVFIRDNEFSSVSDLKETSIPIVRERYNFVSAYSNSPLAEIFQSILTENDNAIVFDMDSTAEAVLMNGFVERYPLETFINIRKFLATNDDYIHYKKYVKDGLEHNIDFLSVANDELYKKVVFIQSQIRNELNSRRLVR